VEAGNRFKLATARFSPGPHVSAITQPTQHRSKAHREHSDLGVISATSVGGRCHTYLQAFRPVP
jgi:hypothetical protein